MNPVSFLGCFCTGHDCFPSRPNLQASTDVYVEGKEVHRQSDLWDVHCCPDHGCHDSFLASGSSTVYVNGLQCSRIGDPVACGSSIMTGAETVYAGG